MDRYCVYRFEISLVVHGQREIGEPQSGSVHVIEGRDHDCSRSDTSPGVG